jgi:hypothetical protein
LLLEELYLLVLKVLRVFHQAEVADRAGVVSSQERMPDHLLMTLRWIAFESINRSGFGRSEGDPVLCVLLKRAKELLAVLHSGIMEFVSALELALECEFADELFLVASRSPDLGYYYLAISSDLKETLQPFTRLPIIGPKFQLRDEQGVEIFYNIALTGWMKLAADLQIVQPGGPARPPRRSLEFGRRSTFKFDPESDAMLLVG